MNSYLGLWLKTFSFIMCCTGLKIRIGSKGCAWTQNREVANDYHWNCQLWCALLVEPIIWPSSSRGKPCESLGVWLGGCVQQLYNNKLTDFQKWNGFLWTMWKTFQKRAQKYIFKMVLEHGILWWHCSLLGWS